jgi:hypothetical protein
MDKDANKIRNVSFSKIGEFKVPSVYFVAHYFLIYKNYKEEIS